MTQILIGLTGRRGVGKSTIARLLMERHGFVVIHPLAGGKAMARLYFERCGASPVEAERMVDGDLKDRPSPFLPGGASPRFFLERFGRFMGDRLGPDWTLGIEVDRALRVSERVVVESVVYEADFLRARRGFIVGVSRPGVSITGIESDSVVDRIMPDARIINDCKIEELTRRLACVVDRAVVEASLQPPVSAARVMGERYGL